MSLRLSRDTRFRIEYTTEELLQCTMPLIGEIHQLLDAGIGFSEAVERSFPNHPAAEKYGTVVRDGGKSMFVLKDEYLWGQYIPTSLLIKSKDRSAKIDLTAAGGQRLLQMVDLLEVLASGKLTPADLPELRGSIMGKIIDFLAARDGFRQFDANEPPLLSAPGSALYRFQHASLFFQDGPTGIIVDPHFHSTYDSAPNSGIDYAEVAGRVSAILISHSHEDHFHLSSLAMFPKDTLILVAKVPHPTVICPNMADLLRQCGFTNVIEAEWYKTNLQVGNMKIWTFPFYGEQPLETEYPRFKDMRNWGNTYVVEVNGIKTWFLIDSGQDVTGAMVNVASKVRETLGSIDIILSNLRIFQTYSPFYINSGLNWFTLAYDQVPGLVHRNDVLTLGSARVAEICKIVGASLYLPYAHWWGDIGEVGDSGLDTPDQEEEPLLRDLNNDLLNIRCSTRILPWRIGDSVPLQGNMAEKQRRPANIASHAVGR